MSEGQASNGRIELHGYQIREITDELKSINSKLDCVLPELAVAKVRLSSLESWRVWATGLGTATVLALLGVVLRVVMG